jgi:predicted CxxxxCH...CXXCH cytochrome family protein
MSIRPLIVLAAAVSIAGCGDARNPVEGQDAASALARCTGCHGDPANGNAAPPRAVRGATATTDVAVGAHQAHLQPSGIRQPLDCSDCHVKPVNVNDPGHIDGATATLAWGPLASARGVTPTPAAGPAPTGDITCTNYCHGPSASAGGTVHAPSWTKVDGSQAGCGTCHGIPPPPPHPYAANLAACANCHPDTIDASGNIKIGGGRHINGIVDLAGGGTGCTSCHGDPNRANAAIAAAPPRGTDGSTDPSSPLVGAHQAHLNAGKYAGAIDCSECHTVPTSTEHATQAIELTFGPKATAYATAASFDPTALTCATFCHGTAAWGGTNHAPVWNQGSTQATCGTCHGIPSSGGSHLIAQHASIIDGCATCHPTYTQNLASHVNGVKDVIVGTAITSWTPSSATTPGTCTASCHSSPTEVRTW